MVVGDTKLMKILIMLHLFMRSSTGGCLAFRSVGAKRIIRAASLSTGLSQSPDNLSTFGPDEPNILATDSDKGDAYTLKLSVPTPEDMEDVGAILSMGTTAGDTILLGGDLGGKDLLFAWFHSSEDGRC